MNPRQPVVSGQRLIKALEAEGWKMPDSATVTSDSRRPGIESPWSCRYTRELRKGTLAGILRDADLGPDDLRRLLN